MLVLSIHPEDQFAVRVLKAGAAGYMTKESAPEALVEAIRRVYSGRKYVSASLAEKLVDSLQERFEQAPHQTLSNREFEVLRLIGSGFTTGQIGRRLMLSSKTISTYRARVLEKMQMHTNAQLIRYAIEHSLSEPEPGDQPGDLEPA